MDETASVTSMYLYDADGQMDLRITQPEQVTEFMQVVRATALGKSPDGIQTPYPLENTLSCAITFHEIPAQVYLGEVFQADENRWAFTSCELYETKEIASYVPQSVRNAILCAGQGGEITT